MRPRSAFACLFVPLTLLACAVARGDAPNARPARPVASSSQEAGAKGGAPVQIAEYPGAPYEDRSGKLWFSTVFEGLVRYDGAEFVTFTTEDGLASDSVRDILEDDDGVLWIATTGGVTTYDGEFFTTLTDYGDTPVTYGFTKEGNHRDVWDILEDRRGALWIATADGVFRLDGGSFAPFPLPVVAAEGSYEFTPNMVYCIFEDRDGVLWFGTDGAGAVSYDGTGMVVFSAEKDGLCSDRVCAILQDARGDFWLGTSGGGVSRYDGSAFTTHLRTATFSEHFGWGRYMAIHEDRDGHVWFGVSSPGGGAWRYDGESFRHFSRADGLGDGAIPSIGSDRSGNVWFGTTAGVYRFDGARFFNFTKAG